MPRAAHFDELNAIEESDGRVQAEPRVRPAITRATGIGLEVLNIAKSFGRRRVVNDISFAVRQGETVGLLGPNGAGKTTLFTIVCGLLAADHGRICLDGQDITRLPMYQRGRMGIGYLPQESSVFRGLSVEQNIAAVVEHRVRNRAMRIEYIEMVLEEFGIAHLRRANAALLSGGERRRVEIARALAGAPQYVLFDEPFAGVDPIVIDDVRKLIGQCARWGIGILITDHNVQATLRLIDRALIIHDGKLLADGTPSQIVANREVRRLYLGSNFSL